MKKNYIQPSVGSTQLTMGSIVMAGSPNINNNGGSGIDPD